MIEELNAIICQAKLTEYYYRNFPDEYSKYEKKLDQMKEEFLKKYNKIGC